MGTEDTREPVAYSALRQEDRPSLKRLLPLPFPMSIFIEPTNRCNFRCLFCPESFSDFAEKTGGYATIDDALFQRILDEISYHRVTRVVRFYMMGEPLLNPRLPDMVRRTKIAGVERIEVTTNGSFLSEKLCNELLDSGLDYLRVSIYSVDEARHKTITGSELSVATIRENIARFRRLRDQRGKRTPFLYLKMIDAFSESENDAFLDMYRPIADEAVIERPMNWNGFDERNVVTQTYAATGVELAEDVDSLLYRYPKHVCPFPFYSVAVNADGDVVACCVDWNRSTKIGNLTSASLTEVWNGEALRAFRKMHLVRRRCENPSCRNCSFLFTSPDDIDTMSEDKIREILG